MLDIDQRRHHYKNVVHYRSPGVRVPSRFGGGIWGGAQPPPQEKYFYLYFSFLYNDSVVRVSASYSSSRIVCSVLYSVNAHPQSLGPMLKLF